MQMWKMAEKKKKSRGGFINTVTVEDELRVGRGVIQRIIDQQLHISQAFSFTRLQQHNEVVLSALGMD